MASKLNRFSLGGFAALALMLVLLGIAPGAAAAGLDKKSTADAKKATQLYKQGNYDEAATIFLQLSIDNPGMPVFVRNLGACYYYLRRPEPALSNLREYLHKKKDIEADDRAEVETWIAEMDRLRQHGSAEGSTTTPPPTGATGPVTPPETPTGRTDVPGPIPLGPGGAPPGPGGVPPGPGTAGTVAQVPPPGESGQGGSTRKVAVWTLGAVGGLGLVMGGVFGYLAYHDFSNIETKYDPGKESQGNHYVTAEIISFCVGGAAIATGAVLLLTGRDAPRSVVVAPTLGPGLAGAALSGTF